MVIEKTMSGADIAALGAGAFFGALSRYQAGKIASDFIATDPKRFGKLTGWQVQKTIYIMICLYPYVGESQQIN